MKRGNPIGRLPVGTLTKRLPGGRSKRLPVVGTITKALPGGGRAIGTVGGVLLGAGAAAAAGKALTGRKGEQGSSNQEEPEQQQKGSARQKASQSKGSDSKGSDSKGSDSKASDKKGSEKSDEQGVEHNGQGVFGRIKDTVGGAIPGVGKDEGKEGDESGKGGGSGGGGKKVKVINIVEHIDIGAPRRLVYDQWTQFQDYPSFMKKVISVDQADETKLNWQAKIFWSKRTWEATIIEQVPDEHIVWRSQGAKGHVDGTVSFHELSPNLTRVLLVLEYHPQGFFERTGNIWRAQGRRVRLEFKHFGRFVMTQSLTAADEVEGWRGEIRDSEVVVTHEDALDDEERDRKEEERDAKSSGTKASRSTAKDTTKETSKDTGKDTGKDTKKAERAEEEYETAR